MALLTKPLETVIFGRLQSNPRRTRANKFTMPHVEIDSETHKKLKRLKKATGKSIKRIVRDAVNKSDEN